MTSVGWRRGLEASRAGADAKWASEAQSERVQALADKYCLKTGDKIAVPAKRGANDDPPARGAPNVTVDVRIEREMPSLDASVIDMRTWSTDLKQAWSCFNPVALTVVSSRNIEVHLEYDADGSVTRTGGNHGSRPMRIANTEAMKDTVSARCDAGPYGEYRVRFRLWLQTEHEREKLAAAMKDRIAALPDELSFVPAKLNPPWVDVGPYLDIAMFRDEVRAIAIDRLQLPVWDDAEVVAMLDLAAKRTRVRAPHGELPQRILEGEIATLMARTGRGR